MQPKTLIRKEEERLIFENGAAEDAAEIILVLLGFREVVEIGEPVVSVQRAIPKIFEQRAMIMIRARASHNRNLSPRHPPELRSKRRGLHTKLFHGIHRHQTVRSACRTQRGQCSSYTLIQREKAGDAEIGAYPVHRKIVRVGALSIHAELSLVK